MDLNTIWLIIGIIGGTLGIGGTAFGIFTYFKNPQVKTEKILALTEEKLKFHEQANNSRFVEIQGNFKDLLTLNTNHIHTLETKLDALTSTSIAMQKDIVRLTTIIEERFPK